MIGAFIGMTSAATAQTSFGIQAGVINSNWKGEALQSLNSLVDLTKGYITTKSKTGFTAGAYATIPVGERFFVEPGISYTQKGYTMQGDLKIDVLNFLGANASANVESHYIDVPLLLKAEVAKGLSIYAGPQVSFLAKSNLHVRAGLLGISLYNDKLDITDQFNKVDMGLSGGLAYTFNNGISFKAGYDHGLSKLDKNDNFKAYNRALKFTVGYTF
ncbi:MAG: porin family protein [Ferruginibacter sp.]